MDSQQLQQQQQFNFMSGMFGNPSMMAPAMLGMSSDGSSMGFPGMLYGATSGSMQNSANSPVLPALAQFYRPPLGGQFGDGMASQVRARPLPSLPSALALALANTPLSPAGALSFSRASPLRI
jgi:hypothetical protein